MSGSISREQKEECRVENAECRASDDVLKQLHRTHDVVILGKELASAFQDLFVCV